MKWVVGILIALNLFVYALANLGSDSKQDNQQASQIDENIASISLLDSGASPLPGNCSNVGPIEQQIVIDQFEKVLVEQSLSYRLVSEASRKVSAYRVIVPITSPENVAELQQRLKVTGVDESFEKTLTNGERVLSLGVFTYKETASELADNLSQTGLSARAEHEFLEYPKRFWINLNKPLDNSTLAGLKTYTGNKKLQQTASKCL